MRGWRLRRWWRTGLLSGLGALLRLGDGASVRGVALEFGTWPNTVTRWRDRFVEDGPAGIGQIRAGRGRKREIPDEVVEAVVAEALTMVPR